MQLLAQVLTILGLGFGAAVIIVGNIVVGLPIMALGVASLFWAKTFE